jgi:hypothetical protein
VRTRGLRRLLEATRQRALDDVAARLTADPGADVEAALRRVDACSKLLTLVKPRVSAESVWAVIVAVLSLGIAGVLWSYPVRETRILLTLQSDTVALRLAKPWLTSGELPLDAARLQLEGLSGLEAPALFTGLEQVPGDAWLRVQGGKASLRQLALGQAGVLELEGNPDGRWDLFTRGSATEGRLLVRGTPHLSVGAGGKVALDATPDLPVPETVVFRAKGDGVIPSRFGLRPEGRWILRDLHVERLGFAREVAGGPGEALFRSGIRTGTLTLHDVNGEKRELREGDRLSVRSAGGRVVELRRNDDNLIHVTFEGPVSEILAGPEGLTRNLAPSLLAYYYHQAPLKFFWSAVVLLSGVLWSVRRTIFP